MINIDISTAAHRVDGRYGMETQWSAPQGPDYIRYAISYDIVAVDLETGDHNVIKSCQDVADAMQAMQDQYAACILMELGWHNVDAFEAVSLDIEKYGPASACERAQRISGLKPQEVSRYPWEFLWDLN